MREIFVTFMLVVANVVGSTMAFPQALRLVRTRNTEGISGAWVGISVSMNVWWLTYGLANELWGLVPVSAIAVVLYTTIAAAYVRIVGVGASRQLAFGSLVLGMTPLPFLLLGGWQLAGIAIGLCYGLQLVPAVLAAYRNSDLSGVAPLTWIMAWIESVIWLAYGASVIDGALLVGGVTGTLMASSMIVRLAVTGHQPLRVRTRSLAQV